MRPNRIFAVFVLILGATGFTNELKAADSPVPLVNQPLVPDAVAPGGPAFTLTVSGTGFVAKSVVNWNGSPRTTTFITKSQLTAAITATDIADAGTASVTVVTPVPGGGTSNVAFLSVTNSTSNVGFRLGSSPHVGDTPEAIGIGDFNGDGNQDLAVVNYESSTVSILLGDGTGNFTLASSPATGSFPNSIAVGDFNGDGKLDLAIAGGASFQGTLSILLGDGTGNFTLASSPKTGESPHSVVAGDWNGDGQLDLAVANYQSGTLTILLGDGTGNFTVASSPVTDFGPAALGVGDFNGDGKLDLAVVNVNYNTFSIFLGDGTGNFTVSSSFATGEEPGAIAVGDFNADDKLDLAIANGSSDTVSILLGDGTGNFRLTSSPPAGEGPGGITVGDFNEDGKLDLAVANENNMTASILMGDNTGNFTLVSSPYTGGEDCVAVADFNGDGKLDFAAANYNENMVSILLQAPAVTLSPASLNFGDLNVGRISAPQTAAVTNVGYAEVDISGIAITGANEDEFSQTNNCPSSLAIGASCTIMVRFKTLDEGLGTAALTISDNGGNNPTTILLTGTAVGIKISPPRLSFGEVKVGQTSQPMVATLTNVGPGLIYITKILVKGMDIGDFEETNTCHKEFLPGGTCNFTVLFTPTQAGSRIANINIESTGGGSPQKITLRGTGT